MRRLIAHFRLWLMGGVPKIEPYILDREERLDRYREARKLYYKLKRDLYR